MADERDARASAAAVEALAAWAAGMRGAALPGPVLERAALVLVDDLTAMLAARDEPEVAALRTRLIERSLRAEATVFRGGRTMIDRDGAAVANAAACDWCELDEGYRLAVCHAGLYVLPALLAEAEAAGRTFGELLHALAVGYEVAARFAHGFPPPMAVYHPHASLAAIGAAAGLAAIRGYDADLFRDAVTAAATMVAPGPFNHVSLGALVRNVWPAQAAWTGLRAAEWAECGIAGRADSPWYVFTQALRCTSDPAAMTAELGERWAIASGYHKLHACCQYVHATVDASLEILASLPPGRTAEGLAAIAVETHARALVLTDRLPRTTLAAKFSLPHAAAATAIFGHAGAPAFYADTLTRPDLARLRERVEIGPFTPEPAPPNDRPARVTWTFADGARFTAECLSARGGPDRPFAPAEIIAKIGGIAGPVHAAFADVAAELIAEPARFAAEPWRAVAARLTA